MHTQHGTFLNPVFDAFKKFTLLADPFSLVLGVGESRDVAMVQQAEENHQGDGVYNELFAETTPTTGRFAVQIKSRQNDKTLMSVPILMSFVFGNSQFGAQLSCCIPLQATNFIQITVTNVDTVPITVKLGMRGARFLFYQCPEMREEMLALWNSVKITNYWLGIDRIVSGGVGVVAALGGGVVIPAATTATVAMTVPGGGDFLADQLLHEVIGADARDIIIRVTEGVGRALSSEDTPLGTFAGQGTAVVAGVQDGEIRPSAGNHVSQYKQWFKRNTRMRISVENTTGGPVTVFLCYKGCMYYYPECPPGRGLRNIRSLEPTIGPSLIQAPRGCGLCGTCGSQVMGSSCQRCGAPGNNVVPPTGYTQLPGLPGPGQAAAAARARAEAGAAAAAAAAAEHAARQQTRDPFDGLGPRQGQGGMGGHVYYPDGGRGGWGN
jgi:hypothetical protein